MNAIRVEEFGPPETMRWVELPTPEPGSGQVLVRLHAAGVNPLDTYLRSGQHPKAPPLPYTPGLDGAGRVESAPAVLGLAPGQRVYVAAGSLTGTYAEWCVCEAAQVYPLPEGCSFAEGAALGVPYGTAYRALFQRAKVQPGETVLIHGGTGGVGLAALQLARAAGFPVLATGGSPEGLELLRREGAQAVFDHHAPDYAEQILAHTGGRGVEVILEMLANVNLGRDLTLLTKKGRVAVIGSRGPVEINPRETMTREADIRGVMLSEASAEEVAEAHRAIGEGLQAGKWRPVIAQQYPASEAPAAHVAVLQPGTRGKIVLVL